MRSSATAGSERILGVGIFRLLFPYDAAVASKEKPWS